MAAQRLSCLQKKILSWLVQDHQRTKGMITSSHEELVQHLQADKGNISRSLQTLETRGWIILGRSPGGNMQHLTRTPAGHTCAAQVGKKL
jgi:DNA-binding MarR family transcriptional regulator